MIASLLIQRYSHNGIAFFLLHSIVVAKKGWIHNSILQMVTVSSVWPIINDVVSRAKAWKQAPKPLLLMVNDLEAKLKLENLEDNIVVIMMMTKRIWRRWMMPMSSGWGDGQFKSGPKRIFFFIASSWGTKMIQRGWPKIWTPYGPLWAPQKAPRAKNFQKKVSSKGGSNQLEMT